MMTKEEFVNRMNQQVQGHVNSVRQARAAFLVWFLINYFRIDEDSAIDLVCDGPNDRGIDGIFIDDLSEEIYLFQSKFSPNPGNRQGENDIRNLVGARAWFVSADSIEQLDQSAPNQEVKSLLVKLEVPDRVSRNYKVVLIFITNLSFDRTAVNYLGLLGDEMEAWDLERLYDEYTYTGRDQPVSDTFTFTLDPANKMSYQTSEGVEVIIFPAKATEVVCLKGIQDRSLFARNVRYGLGRTRVNRDIARTLGQRDEHTNFFLYHNGVTLICSDFRLANSKLDVTNYSIVNGCQSTLSFYENRLRLNDNIKILIKVIKTGTNDRISKNITYYNNNQNSISLKDLKSNDKIQQDLQDEFFALFNRAILFKIKSGEDESRFRRVIENDFAAQLITSFHLKEPHTAHQKSRIFSDSYNLIFNRKINASGIFVLDEVYRAIDQNSERIEDEGIRSYKLARFFFVYVFRLIFEQDPVGKQIIVDPVGFLTRFQNSYFEAFEKLFRLVVIDFNNFVSDQKQLGYFDYKNTLRNAARVSAMAQNIVTAYKKLLVHHPEDAFSEIVNSALTN